jgi:hypothetical protein
MLSFYRYKLSPATLFRPTENTVPPKKNTDWE